MDAHRDIHSGKHHYLILSLVLAMLIFSLFYSAVIKSEKIENLEIISCNISFNEPNLIPTQINNTIYTRIDLPGCVNHGKPGEPSLPIYSAQILIPYSRQVKNIDISHDNWISLNYDFIDSPVVPEQELIPFSVSSDNLEFKINNTAYNSYTPLKKDIFDIGEIGFCKGYKIQTVYLYPVKYIPKTGLLYYLENIRIDVELDQDVIACEPNNFLRQKNNDQALVDIIVENPEDINTYQNGDLPLGGDIPFEYSNGLCDPLDNYDYVIITSESLRDTDGTYNWSDLIDHRQSYSSLSGTIVTVEDIDSCSAYWNDTALFNDTQAHMREFCKDAYQDWGTEYVLIGGDWGTSGSQQCVPFRLFDDRYETQTYDTMASDIYFSHLDGDFYYSGSGGIWGGGANSGVNDLYSELYVGRITAYDSDMVSNAVQKIINYDLNQSLSTNWLRTVSFWGGDLGWSATSKDYMEEIRLGTDTYRTFTGFEEWNTDKADYAFDTTERLYHEDLGIGYQSEFSDSVEADTSSIVNHLDHSSWLSPMGLTSWSGRYNTMPFLGYSQGCLAGRYHSGYAGCEQLICKFPERHAFALILNTGYGYGFSSSTNGASQYVNAYFWDYFFNNQSENQENWQLGKAMAYTQDKMASVMNSKSHSWCYSWYSANFFGDPAQCLRLNGTSINSEVSYQNENPSDGSSDVSILLDDLYLTINDPEGSSFDWSIETYPDIGSASGSDQYNGTKHCNVSNLGLSTTYNWYVNTSDGNSWNNDSFSFTTRSSYQPSAPDSFTANAINRFQIDLTWNDDSKSDSTRVEWSSVEDQSWNIMDHNLLYNGTLESISHENLEPNNRIYYKAWSYNSTDGIWSSSSSCNEITISNNAPIISSEDPENNSIDQSLNFSFRITIEDLEGDSFNWTIESSNGQSNSSNIDSNGTKNLYLINLDYGSSYTIWVNVSDLYNTTKNYFIYTTVEESTTPAQNNEAPISGSIDCDISPILSVICTDPNEDNLDAYFYSNSSGDWLLFGQNLSFNSGTNISQINHNFSDFNTKYFWSVNLTDGNEWVNYSYDLTTRQRIVPETPSNFNAAAVNRFKINLNWDKVQNSDYTIIEYNTSSDWIYGEGNLLYNGTGTSYDHDSLNPNTTYYYQAWSYNLSDNSQNLIDISSNATTISNNAPLIFDINPNNNSENVSISLDQVSINIYDLEGDFINYSIEGKYLNNTFENLVGNKTIYANISSNLPYDTQIKYYVNLSDAYDASSFIYYFTTVEQGIPSPPDNFNAIAYNRTRIDLNWNDNLNNSYLEFNTIENWTTGEGILLLNSTNNSCSHNNLDFDTRYFYQLWSYNTTNNIFSNTFSSINQSTNANTAPVYSEISPSNGSTGVSNTLSQLSIMINDNDSDLFSWNITTSPNIGNNSGFNSSNDTKKCSISGLSYSTTYYWTVKTFDSYNWTITTYHFTTKSRPSSGGGGSGGGGGPPSPPPAEEEEEENETEEPEDQNQTEDNDLINQTEDSDIEDTNDSLIPPIEDEIEEENDELTDSDYDGVPDIIEEEFSEDLIDPDSIEEIVINEENNYLIDSDNDGLIDKYINVKDKLKTKVEYLDEFTILIDENDDDVWDYQYDLSTRSISSYVGLAEKEENKSNFLFNIWYLFGGIILLFTCISFAFRKKLSLLVTDYRLSRVNDKLEHMKHHRFSPDSNHIHFFSKDKDKKHLVKHVKNVKKAKKKKTYYYHDSKDKDILISNRPSFADISPNVSKKSVYNTDLDFHVDKVILSKIKDLKIENYRQKSYVKDEKLKEIEEKIDKMLI